MAVPEHFLLTYAEYNSFFANIDKNYVDVFGTQNMKVYIRFLLIVLGDEFSRSAIHVKAKLLDQLFIFNSSNDSKTSALLKEQLDNRKKRSMFINSILKFFVSIEFMTDFVSIRQSKYRYRWAN